MSERVSFAEKGTVYLVGAGPGDPELLTLRASRLLASADVVLHDDLVPEAVLETCCEGSRVQNVGKRCGRAYITQPEIHRLMIGEARAGRSVVRLKSGDPLVFGRAGEELAALHAAAIPVEIVPGVSAVFAAAAALQLPLTDRRTASKLVLATGHHAADKSDPAPIWQGRLPQDETLAIYMPGRDLGALASELIGAGVDPETPCAAISRASTPQQKLTAATLATLGSVQPGPAPVLLVVGDSVHLLPNR